LPSKEKIEQLRKTAQQSTQGVVIIGNRGVIENIISNVNINSNDNPLQKASIILEISPLFNIISSNNVSGFSDNGIGDISIVFDKDFSDNNYIVRVIGDKTVSYEILEQTKSAVRMKFDENNLKKLQIECAAV